jgi:CHAD domain-containing protein
MDGPGADEVVGRYLTAQVEALVRLGPRVRTDAPDAVHQMRVVARRLRSVIGSFQPLLERRRTETVRVGLRVLGEVLAPVRDSEVMLAYFATVDPEPVVLVVREHLAREHALGRTRLLAAMEEGEHDAVVQSLTLMLDPSPFRPRATAPADATLRPLLEEADSRVRLAMTLALSADASSRDEHLHEVRKLSKRARYAAEAAAPAVGEPARALAASMTAIQDALGRHQDTVQTIRVIQQVRESRPDHDPRAFDRLVEVQQARGEAAVGDYERLLTAGGPSPLDAPLSPASPAGRPQSRKRENRGSLSHHGRSRSGSSAGGGS